MSNPFKEILHHHKVPKALKKKVLNDVNIIKLSIDIADLFLVKYPNTLGHVFGNHKKNTTKK